MREMHVLRSLERLDSPGDYRCITNELLIEDTSPKNMSFTQPQVMLGYKGTVITILHWKNSVIKNYKKSVL